MIAGSHSKFESKSVIVVDNASYHNAQIYRHLTSKCQKSWNAVLFLINVV